MPSLWVDLLRLHGHLCDLRWLPEPAAKQASAASPSAPVGETKASGKPRRRFLPSWRLCLGIGDGELRSQ